MEEGVHTTDTEEIVGAEGMVVFPTDPPLQPAITSSNHNAAGIHSKRRFKPLSPQYRARRSATMESSHAHSPHTAHLYAMHPRGPASTSLPKKYSAMGRRFQPPLA